MFHLRSSVLVLFAGFLLMLAQSILANPITHEDVWLMPRVGSPILSPDGSKAIVSVTKPAYDRAEQSSNLYLIDVLGDREVRQLTFTASGESQVTWSPDSTQIAFRAKRAGDDKPQIYVLSLTQGGEAMRVTNHPQGAAEAVFSPDGTRIAFVSQITPSQEMDPEEVSAGVNVRTYTGFPIRNWNHWLDGTEPRLFVQTIGEEEYTDLIGGSELVQSPGFAGSRAISGAGLSPIWTPDGERIVFSASDNRHRYAFDYTNQDLWLVEATGGEPGRLTGSAAPEGDDSYSSAAFSPDGRYLVASKTPRTERVFNASKLVVWSWPDAEVLNEIQMPNRRGVGEFVMPSNDEVYVLGQDAGHVKIFQADLINDSETRLSFEVDSGIYAGLQGTMRDGELVLLGSWQAAHQPAEVVRIDVGEGVHQPLTQFTQEAVAGLDLLPVEHFWFENDEGMAIHSLLVKPANFDPQKRYPALALMHGGPHSQWQDYFFIRWNYHLLAREDFVLILTNFRGSTGFGEAFAQAIEGDPLKGPADDINAAVDVAIERYAFIDETRQCAGGASYGGHLANWMQSSTDRYRCLISHAGLVNLATQWGTSDAVYHREANMGGPPWALPEVWAEHNPINFAEQWQTPVLVTIGMKDERVPLANSLEYWTALQRQQIESRLLVYPDEDHWIMSGPNSRHFYGELNDWLQHWLLD